MTTAGDSTLSIILDLVVLVAGLQAAFRLRPVNRQFPVVALVTTIVIGVPSLLQFPFPAIGDALSRRPQLELSGQWWRVLTALLAQDGGLVGAIFTLFVVAMVVALGERAWGALANRRALSCAVHRPQPACRRLELAGRGKLIRK